MGDNRDISVLLRHIEHSQVGYNYEFSSPFGTKQVVYADYTASGRSLSFIEEYINSEVLPCYANTHTTTSYTSKQSTLYREEARSIIKESLHCSDEDVLIFTGTGCTGAIHKLVHCLSLEKLEEPPVIFIGPFEHHSNLLPWKELLGAQVIRIKENDYGELDVVDLEMKLVHYFISNRTLIGAFNAASNITGVLTDVDRVSTLMHTYGGLVFWDYAAAAPYVKIDMNPAGNAKAYKDAVYFSMHKFVGGPDTPGVLVAKKKVFRNEIPHIPGGGTVVFVTKCKHRYLEGKEAREEGGTPSIIGAIRAGLAIQLKDHVGSSVIMSIEKKMASHVFSQWERVKELVIVGPHGIPRIPIFSFLVHHPPSGLFLHHYFVSALLNDLFGIQARGGCSCAGPYGQGLLNISEEQAMKVVMDEVPPDDSCERELTKPGMTRVNFPYFMNQDTVDYIIKAVTMVAKQGWKLLSQYSIDPKTGTFRHRSATQLSTRKYLRDALNVMMVSSEIDRTKKAPVKDIKFEKLLEEAQRVFDTAFTDEHSAPPALNLPDRVRSVRWFLLPEEAWQYGNGRTSQVTRKSFCPKVYLKRTDSTLIIKPHPETKTFTKQPLTANQSFRLQFSDQKTENSKEEVKSIYTMQINSTKPKSPSTTASAIPGRKDEDGVEVEEEEKEEDRSHGRLHKKFSHSTPSLLVNTTTASKHKKSGIKGVQQRFKSMFKGRN